MKYHDFVFKDGKLIGMFEEMYQKVKDPWNQSDISSPIKQLAIKWAKGKTILDVGCGKGRITSELKGFKVGIDISKTAIGYARRKYPHIPFFEASDITGQWDLITFISVLYYIKDWKKVLRDCSKRANKVLILCHIPEKTYGTIKSIDNLVSEVKKNYKIQKQHRQGEYILLLLKSYSHLDFC